MPSECRRVVRIRRLHAGALTPRRVGIIDFAYTICAFRLFHDSRYIQWALVHGLESSHVTGIVDFGSFSWPYPSFKQIHQITASEWRPPDMHSLSFAL